MSAPFADEFPSLYGCIEKETNARLKKNANKEFVKGSSKPDLVRALCMTAAKRHCAEAKREYAEMEALFALVLKATKENIQAECCRNSCEDEWVRLIELFVADEVPPATGSFSSPRKPPAFAERFSGLIGAMSAEKNDRLKKQANKEFLPGGSPNKSHLIEALLLTAAKRHCAEAKRDYDGMDALFALVLKATQEQIKADGACEDEWVDLIKFFEAKHSPSGVADFFGVADLAPRAPSFSSPREPPAFAERFSGLIGAMSAEKNDRLKKQANKEFLTNSSPNKSHLIEALLHTAAKRHCNEMKREYAGMDALFALVLKETRDKIEADGACEDEWVDLIELSWAKYSPSSVVDFGGVADVTSISHPSVKKNLSADFDEVRTFSPKKSKKKPSPKKSANPPRPPPQSRSRASHELPADPDSVGAGSAAAVGMLLLILVAWLMEFFSLLFSLLVVLVAFAYYANSKSKSA
jgi:hypothetical protein